MRKSGFTLIELLGVITVMGLIALIIVPSMDKTIKKGKQKAIESTKTSLITSVENWLTENKILFDNDETSLSITLQQLKQDGFVNYEIKDPIQGKCLSNSMTFTITKNNKKYDISMDDEDLLLGTDVDCDPQIKLSSIYLLGSNPLNIEINTPFVDPGAVGRSLDGNIITDQIIKSAAPNTSIIQKNFKYNYSITLTNPGNPIMPSTTSTTTVTRYINVVDTKKPVIIGSSKVEVLKSNTTFSLLDGIHIIDNSGETITPYVSSNFSLGTNGTYSALYVATDSSGNSTSFERQIVITDSSSPVTPGTIVYYNPVSNSLCSDYTAQNSDTGNKTGCMKWYIYNDAPDKSTVKLILDHNTTGDVKYNATGSNASMVEAATELNNLTSVSGWTVSPSIISAEEISNIIGYTDFTLNGSTTYLDIGEDDATKFKFGWLYDRASTSCINTNCPYNATGTTPDDMWGYWTSSIRFGNVWVIDRDGRLHDATANVDGVGLRPVISLPRAKIF